MEFLFGLALDEDERIRIIDHRSRDGRNALHWSCRNGMLDACKWLVSKGADVDSSTKDGTTGFHWAVWQGHLNVAQWLVSAEAKADFRSVNSYGCNAVQWAAQQDNVGMCRFLKEIGLDLTLKNNNGHSAVHKAAVKGRLDVCKWLLESSEHGGGGLSADHLKADGDGNTPSEMARIEGFAELASFLKNKENESQ